MAIFETFWYKFKQVGEKWKINEKEFPQIAPVVQSVV